MRFGFAGLGYAARSLHIPAARSLSGSQLVGGVDLDRDRRAAWSSLGAGRAYERLDQLLEDARPDVLVVGTPPGSHADVCVAALEAGVNVVCEKPFVETLEQADRVLDAASRNGRWVAVNHEFRYMPIFASLSEAIAGGEWGRPVFLHCTQFMDLAPWEEEVSWRAAMQDRSLFEGGIHIVDLLHMLVGRLPHRVFAAVSSGLEADRRADAIHLVTLDYGGGLLAQITIDRLCRAGTRYVDLRVDLEEASLVSSLGGRAFVQVGAERGIRPGIRLEYGLGGMAWVEQGLKRRVLARNRRDPAARATGALYAATLDAVGRGQQPPTSAHVARDTLRIVQAAYRAAETGQPVEVSAHTVAAEGAG